MPVGKDPVPQDPPATFDPAVFMTQLLGEFDKRVNALDKKITAISKVAKEPVAPVDPNAPPSDPAAPPAEQRPNPAIADPAVNAEVLSLRKEIARVSKENKENTDRRVAAEKAQAESERVGAIRAALQEIPFRTTDRGDSLIDAAYKLVAPDVVKAEDGSYVVNSKDNGALPLKDFVKGQFLDGDMSFMVAPKGSGGSGARQGQTPSGGGRRWTAADLDPAKLNTLTPQEDASLRSAIQRGEVQM